MLYLGCDPGLKGGFSLLDRSSQIINAWPMPLSAARKIDPAIIYKFLHDIETISIDRLDDVFFAIEKAITMPSDVESIIDRLFKIDASLDEGDYDKAKELCADCREIAKKRDGRVGVLAIGQNFGIILGAVAAFGWGCEIVPARTWQKEMWVGTDHKLKPKDRTFQAVSRLWPNQQLSIGKSRKFHDGICDATAIAEYIRRKMK
jgi:hypothetical protein